MLVRRNLTISKELLGLENQWRGLLSSNYYISNLGCLIEVDGGSGGWNGGAEVAELVTIEKFEKVAKQSKKKQNVRYLLLNVREDRDGGLVPSFHGGLELGHMFNEVKTCKTRVGEVRQAEAIVQRQGDALEPQQQAAVMGSPHRKINLISCGPMVHVSDIKLIRTDTTLDLSQKAEKGMINSVPEPYLL
ncbi:Serine/threonine-protein kinase ZRK7 [Sesamum angolense]|uniref:Serine/threonine-protein kinase ZRK7 n=1 Tax=Sesamum angolense TaxID=2727404 RepID=A0AAE2BM41_9LAMI|nr:Serine/threonine-protein kinase ZRK7 [Sesamum angolense]